MQDFTSIFNLFWSNIQFLTSFPQTEKPHNHDLKTEWVKEREAENSFCPHALVKVINIVYGIMDNILSIQSIDSTNGAAT